MSNEINKDYIAGYKSALVSGHVYTHARVMKILQYVQAELEDIAKSSATDGIVNEFDK